MRIVQLANFVSSTSGGIRTTIDWLRCGYAAAGHQTAVIIPGLRSAREDSAAGTVVTIRSPRLPASGGYRMIANLRAVGAALEDLQPDVIEVNDRFTLRVVGDWAAANGIRATVIVHERLDRLVQFHLPWMIRSGVAASRDNRAVAGRFDRVVSPSAWGAQEFIRAGVHDVEVVGWGVDSQRFHPDQRSAVVRRRLLDGADVLLAMVCRLSPEKRPENAVAGLAALRERGVDARLVIAGTGATETAVRRAARGLPVTFLGHLSGRDHVAELLAAADVAICPGPLETFGLAALEAMAAGTPVVCSVSGAVPELLAPTYGRSVHSYGPSMAGAVQALLAQGERARVAARVAALDHPWPAAIERMLAIHGLADGRSDAFTDREHPG